MDLLLNAVKVESLEYTQELTQQQDIPHDPQWKDYEAINVALENKQKDLALQLLQKNCRVNKPTEPGTTECTPLHKAAKSGDSQLVTALLDKGASIVAVDCDGNSPLHIAFLNGHSEIINTLLTSVEKNLQFANIKNKQGLTHLHIASTTSNSKVIEGLLKTKTYIEDPVKYDSPLWPGFTAMHFAVEYKSVEGVRILSTQTKGILQQIQNKSGHTAKQLLHQQIQNLVKIKNMLSCHQIHFEDLIHNPKNRTQLHKKFYADKYVDSLGIDYALGDLKDKNTNHTDVDGLSHMHIACTRSKKQMVKNYLDNGADVNARVHYKKRVFYKFTPLHAAVFYEQMPTARLLIERGANVNANDDGIHGSPLHIALKSKHKNLVDLLLKNGADVKSIRSNDGGTTLHALLEKSYVKLYKPKRKNARVQTKFSFLEMSACVSRLVELGLDIDTKDREGNTALHLVCHEDLELPVKNKVIWKLLECGADVTAKNNQQLTPIDIMFHEDSLFSSENDTVKCKIFYSHMENLKALGQVLDPVIEQYCRKFQEKAMDTQSLQFVKETFINEREERLDELDKLKTLKVNSTNSLYDVLQVIVKCEPEDLTNSALNMLIGTRGFKKQFPVFSYLIRLECKKFYDCA